jgi:methyl-accepting chemotaxis protein
MLKKIRNMKFVARLHLIILVTLIVAVTLGLIGFSQTTKMSATMDEIYRKGLTGGQLLSEANHAIWELRLGTADYAQAKPENRKKIVDARPGQYAALDEILKKFVELMAEKEQEGLLQEFNTAYQTYKSGSSQVFEMVDAGKLPEAAELNASTSNVAADAMLKSIGTLRDHRQKVNEEIEKETLAATTRMHTLLAVLGILGFIGTAIAIRLLSRSLNTPLEELRAGMIEVGRSGDFTHRIGSDHSDEIGQAIQAYDALIANLRETLRKLLDIVAQVAQSAHSASNSASVVASSSLKQSEATSAIAATVEEVTVSISHVSDSAKTALEISHRSGELCSQGGNIIHEAATGIMQIADSVRQTSAAIEALGQQSKEISSVVQVIKEVADQTNLLALNAAIEAARAGEQGRGFAVVADEVRKLAERTSKATEEITNMITTLQARANQAIVSMGEAVAKVDGGVALAHKAGGAISQIETEAGKVINVVSDISSMLMEQSIASNNIAKHVENVALMTESNSTAANETAKVANILQDLANVMRETVSRFKV